MAEPDIVADLRGLEPYQFEQFVGDLWERRGWETEVSSESRDGGIDIVSWKEEPFSQKQIIQAKRYADGNKVSSRDVQQYYALHDQESGVDSVVIVTTSEFTSDAKQRADELNVKLVDGDTLIDLIDGADAYDLVGDYTDADVEASDVEVGETETPAENTAAGGQPEEDMSTGEAIIAVLQGVVALAVILTFVYVVAQAVVL